MAEETVRAILTDTEMVLMPWYSKYLILLKALIPVAGFSAMSEAFGIKNSMDYWVGRE